MGKLFESELAQLSAVYDWAMAADIRPTKDLIGALAENPLLAIGSGGSLTAAVAACYFHQRCAQKLAHAVTPMEAVSLPTLQDVGVLMTTGGGRNPDILGCFRRLVEREPQQFGVICATHNTPLSDLAAAYWYVRTHEFSLPSGKDGFIATNSLVATIVLLARSYQELYADEESLPNNFSALWGAHADPDESLRLIESAAEAVMDFDSLVVLYGPTGFPAALDLESKCSETGLANVQLADYRNFAHGRHHGLSVRSAETAVLAIVTDDDRELALKTLSLLPTAIRVATISVDGHGCRALVGSLVSVIHWVGARGRGRRMDPGRPAVASFGRKLYHLRSFRARRAPRATALAIERKTRTSITRLRATGALQRWDAAVHAAVGRYAHARFSAVVFDYDGTLCPAGRRMHRDMAAAIERLLFEGILVGIATGRGKSVREDLVAHLPHKHWESVWIGYYNGGQIATLSNDSVPDKTLPVHEDLERFVSLIEADEQLSTLVKLDQRSSQITVFPRAFRQNVVWEALQDLCRAGNQPLVRSTHSFDILAPSVSKLNVVRKIAEVLGVTDSPAILRIGDLGRWPGNDHELLADEYGLSVDQASCHPAQCWNFAPAGHRGSQATLDYLDALSCSNGAASLDLKMLDV